MTPLALLPVIAQLAAAPAHDATVLFAGDVVPHGDVLESLHAHGPASLLGPLAGVLARADLAVVNLETPVVPTRPESPDGTLRFNAPASLVTALAEAGVDAVSLANNHGYDQGERGVAETLRAVREAGVASFGAADAGADPLAPARFPLAGGTLCVMGFTRILNFDMAPPSAGVPRLAMALPERPDEERAVLARVRQEAGRCGALVVSVHTGVEYTDRPEPRDRAFFHALADAGADVVVGHHSHTPHPAERYAARGRDVPIFYSLGNLVSAQGSAAERAPLSANDAFQVVRDARTREGLLAVVRFAPAPEHRLRVASWGWTPLWTRNDREAARAARRHVEISASVMPWNGGDSRFLRARWQGLASRIGSSFLLPSSALPGADTVYETPNALQASR